MPSPAVSAESGVPVESLNKLHAYFDCPGFDPNGLVPLVKQMES